MEEEEGLISISNLKQQLMPIEIPNIDAASAV
jgi:hypothetical protein